MPKFLRGLMALSLASSLAIPAFAQEQAAPAEAPADGATAEAAPEAAAASTYVLGDAAKGEKVFKKCLACHSVEEGAPSKAGPNLFGIVDRQTAAIEGFAYSKPMGELGAAGHVWSLEELDKFAENPKVHVPGTKMAFAGLKKPEDRADLLAYLVTLKAN